MYKKKNQVLKIINVKFSWKIKPRKLFTHVLNTANTRRNAITVEKFHFTKHDRQEQGIITVINFSPFFFSIKRYRLKDPFFKTFLKALISIFS